MVAMPGAPTMALARITRVARDWRAKLHRVRADRVAAALRRGTASRAAPAGSRRTAGSMRVLVRARRSVWAGRRQRSPRAAGQPVQDLVLHDLEARGDEQRV